MIEVRPIHQHDADTWAAMRARLWPAADPRELAAQCTAFIDGYEVPTIAAAFIAKDEDAAVGFLELAMRSFSDGCDSMPVPHVEGWYVEPSARRRGVGRALMQAAEDWARSHGFAELASDTEPWNEVSITAHAQFGFEETERLIKFRKLLP